MSEFEDGPAGAPPSGTVEAWCLRFLEASEMRGKLYPQRPPAEWEDAPHARRPARPARPPELRVVERSPRTPRAGALARPEARAQLLHTFLHHELQAAELFAWAVLAFPAAPHELRAGFLRLCQEELAHLHLYRAHLEVLGAQVGDHPVRDWFWQRGVQCVDEVAFLAFVGLGLEGANLEHSERFAQAFRAVGDEPGAVLQERIQADEVRHVGFAAHWFRELTGGLEYERWRAALPAPLTPALLRGLPLNRAARLRAGFDEAFLERLLAEPPTDTRP